MIETNHPEISVSRQCELLGLARSSLYYESEGEAPLNLQLMGLLDEEYTKHPFYGVRKMTDFLERQGHKVNRKRVRRLLRLMGLEAIYPKPRLSRSEDRDRKFPYLLAGLDLHRPNQVWATDITYIRMRRGFLYLTAILDWYSRYVVAWRLSNSLDACFCLEALDEALSVARPDIFNSDQGTQFTSREFTGRLLDAGVRISMDGAGRFLDNIFTERLWRTVKYEEVYLKDYVDAREAQRSLAIYWAFYNNERPHQALDYRTPAEVYAGAV